MRKQTIMSEALEKKCGLKKTESNSFVKELFALLKEALLSEGQVKIKGLGTFKLVTVKPRESVNIQSGKRFVIEGYNKITFTPETSVKDAVNAPFAQFETVVLNDGVDFSEIDKESNFVPNDDVVVTEEDAIEEEVVVEEPTATESEETPIAEEPVIAQEEPATEKEPVIAEEPAAEQTENEPVVEEVPTAEQAEGKPAVEEVVPQVVVTTTQAEPVSNEEDADDDDNTSEISTLRKHVKILMIAVCALIVLMGVGGYLYCSDMVKKNNRIAHLETMLNQETAKPAATPQQATKEQEQANAGNIDIETLDEPAPTAQPTNNDATKEAAKAQADAQAKAKADAEAKAKAEAIAKAKATEQAKAKAAAEAEAKKAAQASSKYDSDPRVKYGAYRIIGTDQVVTVKAGQTISSISKAYLGPGMECYVEALNGGIKEAKVGQKIKIPKLQKKK